MLRASLFEKSGCQIRRRSTRKSVDYIKPSLFIDFCSYSGLHGVLSRMSSEAKDFLMLFLIKRVPLNSECKHSGASSLWDNKIFGVMFHLNLFFQI